MAASTSGAIKARLEGLQFGVPVFRDGPRKGQDPPFIVVQEGMPAGLDASGNGDFGDPAASITIVETVVVDLVQYARAKVNAQLTRTTERYGLAEAIAHALHGCQLLTHPAPVHAVRVQDIDRIPIEDNRVRHSITVQVHRELLREEVKPQ
ncbi:hypothetical protein [Streptomyces griseoviridis]|uniref:Dihydroneopterin aldolase n=1 Tax=Streptomyces griseoviridis TaxID=45398 RepID=A0ABT9LF57_STRGD|nr:hypothetical protein [Streptomyces griseoviridis]MDP9682364.1 hypothetical protein [Streptomyces griseoviridis]GGS82003.1 hypothetical protein GCM10010240_14230 [Streptomyces griseoviridis]